MSDENILEIINSQGGILGNILTNEYEDILNAQVIDTDAPDFKANLILDRCTSIYKEIIKLQNTDPYWGMANIDNTVWRLRDLCTDGYLDRYGIKERLKEMKCGHDTRKHVRNIRRIEMGIELLKNPRIVNCTIIDSKYFQICINFISMKRFLRPVLR